MPAAHDTAGDEDVLGYIAAACNVPLTAIEDLYPCTPLQIGIMAQPNERIYINCVYATLGPSIDTDRFCNALSHIYSVNPVLRTRIVDCEFGLVQVILKENLSISCPSKSLAQVLDDEKSAPMSLCTPLFRAALLGRVIILTTHHAIADGGTYHRMFDNLSRVYHGHQLPFYASFKLFVKHCLAIEEAEAKSFWGPRFCGNPTIFPKIDVEYFPDASSKLATQISFGPYGLSVSLGLMSSYIETAWAITVMSYTNAESVVFGRVLSARAPVLGGLESTLGPTIVTMPVQVNLSKDFTIAGLIKERAQERREALKSPVLQYGLTRIRTVNDAAKIASRFTTLLNFRTPTDDGRDYSSSDIEIHGEYEGHLPYGLGISIVLSETGLSVETLFDEKVLCERQTRRILRQFEHILTMLLQRPAGTRLDKLDLLNTQDRQEILNWNIITQEPPEKCLHNMFRDIVIAQPNAIAVDGPDGSLTYQQLDKKTNLVASDLQRRGVTVEDNIALIFQKSTWAVVAQLAVLKAGGVCVPIDPGFPFSRKQTIISNSRAKLILTSAHHQDSLVDLGPAIIVINAQSARKPLVEESHQPGNQYMPSMAAFILFTSGSTGTPKGHILEHRNLVSSLRAIGRDMGWGPGVRMLQFAAYVWDMSIAEIFGTLISGGCICIPSEEARESFITEFIQSHGVNCAIFTPTVLRMITKQEAPSLKAIMSIGEPVDLESVNMWSDHARFFNAWGPSETACVSSMAELKPNSPYRESIGRPLASAIWLVEEKNVNKLVPVGGVGEIVVESLGVSRGYLNEPRQTAASFIPPPPWARCRKGVPSIVPQRMYRTGDLAKYNPDGSLEYIGRLDNQVKISGQRVELGEIEKVLSSCLGVRHAITAIQVSKHDNNRKELIAVLTLEEPRLSTKTALKELSSEFRPKVEQSLEGIREALTSRLPSYMIPTIWRVVEDFPRTASLKLDRSSIKKWLKQWEPDQTKGVDIDSLTPTASSIERCLQTTWALALSVPESEIGRESSFIKLGGDSILAIKVATQCRKRGVRISVATILRSENLANAAAACELLTDCPRPLTSSPPVGGKEGISSLTLSPFQQLLVQDGLESLPPNTCQYSFRCKIAHINVGTVEQAILKLAAYHPMLRARLVQEEQTWTQTILPVSELKLRVRAYSLGCTNRNVTPTAMMKPLVPINEAMLIADILLSEDDEYNPPVLLLTSYSLIDKLSWRTICEDLETLLVNPKLEPSRTAPFSEWIQAKIDQVSKIKSSHELSRTQRRYWGLNGTACDISVVDQNLTIDAVVTRAIFGACNRAFNTHPIELLIAAIILSFRRSFPDRGTPALYSYDEGRDIHNGTILDFSRTVGYFGTLLPINSNVQPESSVEEAIIMVKDSYRYAIRYEPASFATSMLGNSPLTRSDIEILFNFDDLEVEDSVRAIAVTSISHLGLFKIHARRLNKELTFCISYNKSLLQQDHIRLWVSHLEDILRAMASQLVSCKPTLTLSETPLQHMDHIQLKQMQKRLEDIGVAVSDVEALLPCSPVQEGILFSQLKNSHHQYWMKFTMKLTSKGDNGVVDDERVRVAWRAICSTQPILRTILVSHETNNGVYQQVILKTIKASISYNVSSLEQIDIESMIDALEMPQLDKTQPPHHLHLTRVSPGAVYVTLYINHALFDERSMQLVGEQLGLAYTNANGLPKGHNLSEYLAWIAQHKEPSNEYWTTYLSGVKPCLVPVLDSTESEIIGKGSDLCDVPIRDTNKLTLFCRNHGVTVANLMQVAWGIVLRQCTNSKSLSFGYLHSHLGSLEGAESILGPLLAMAFYRFDATPNETIAAILKKSNNDASNGLEHGACSLSEIHEAIGIGKLHLFNTIMTVYRLWPENLADTGIIRVEHLPLRGHTEVSFHP
jgi:amino acid adenylation domain-containing protein